MIKKISLFGMALLVLSIAGCAISFTPVPGEYSLSYVDGILGQSLVYRGSADNILVYGYYPWFSRSDEFAAGEYALEENLNLNEINIAKISLGNAGAELAFIIGKNPRNDKNDLYIDANFNRLAELSEKEYSFNIESALPANRYLTLDYMIGEESVKKKLTLCYKIYGSDGDYRIKYAVISIFKGEMDFGTQGTRAMVVLDANANGIFNDEGVDLIAVDLNNDGEININNETIPFQKVITGKDGIYKITMEPWPEKILIEK